MLYASDFKWEIVIKAKPSIPTDRNNHDDCSIIHAKFLSTSKSFNLVNFVNAISECVWVSCKGTQVKNSHDTAKSKEKQCMNS